MDPAEKKHVGGVNRFVSPVRFQISIVPELGKEAWVGDSRCPPNTVEQRAHCFAARRQIIQRTRSLSTLRTRSLEVGLMSALIIIRPLHSRSASSSFTEEEVSFVASLNSFHYLQKGLVLLLSYPIRRASYATHDMYCAFKNYSPLLSFAASLNCDHYLQRVVLLSYPTSYVMHDMYI